MKKIISAAVSCALIMTSFAAAKAETPIRVIADGKYVNFDVEPTIKNDRTLVPVRAVFDALGAQVDWDGENQTVIANKGDTSISMRLNENVLIKNGEGILLDTSSVLVNDRVLVPVRAVSEAFGCNVLWNKYDSTVVIVSDPSKVVAAQIGSEPVYLDEFNAHMMFAKASTSNSIPGLDFEKITDSMWDSKQNGIVYHDLVAVNILEEIAMCRAAVSKSEIQLSDDDIESVYGEFAALAGGYDVAAEALKANNTSEKAFKQCIKGIKTYMDMYETAWKNSAESITDDEIKKYADENAMCAKHILFSVSDESEDAQKKANAEETLKKIKGGADFDELMTALSEDFGTKTNTDGYTFFPGYTVKEFEDAVKSLKIGEVSDVVKTFYGYHIIKREKPDMSKINTEDARSSLMARKINETMPVSETVTSVEEDVLSNILPIKF